MTDNPDPPSPSEGERTVAATLAGAVEAPRDPVAAALEQLHDLAERAASRGADPRPADLAQAAGAVLVAARPDLAADPVQAAGVRLAQRLLGARDPAEVRKAVEEWQADQTHGAENQTAAPALARPAGRERPTLAAIPDIVAPRRPVLLSAAGRPGAVLTIGEVALLSGDGGIGKSTLVNEIALAVAAGAPVLGLLDVHDGGAVLWLAYEEGADYRGGSATGRSCNIKFPVAIFRGIED